MNRANPPLWRKPEVGVLFKSFAIADGYLYKLEELDCSGKKPIGRRVRYKLSHIKAIIAPEEALSQLTLSGAFFESGRLLAPAVGRHSLADGTNISDITTWLLTQQKHPHTQIVWGIPVAIIFGDNRKIRTYIDSDSFDAEMNTILSFCQKTPPKSPCFELCEPTPTYTLELIRTRIQRKIDFFDATNCCIILLASLTLWGAEIATGWQAFVSFLVWLLPSKYLTRKAICNKSYFASEYLFENEQEFNETIKGLTTLDVKNQTKKDYRHVW